MDCLINLVAFCLLDPSKVYVTGELQQVVSHDHTEGRWCSTQWCRGPMGVLRIGTSIDVTRSLEVNLGFIHQSDITINDQGDNGWFANVTWHPLARR